MGADVRNKFAHITLRLSQRALAARSKRNGRRPTAQSPSNTKTNSLSSIFSAANEPNPLNKPKLAAESSGFERASTRSRGFTFYRAH
jgi:hypothetical protein